MDDFTPAAYALFLASWARFLIRAQAIASIAMKYHLHDPGDPDWKPTKTVDFGDALIYVECKRYLGGGEDDIDFASIPLEWLDTPNEEIERRCMETTHERALADDKFRDATIAKRKAEQDEYDRKEFARLKAKLGK